MKSWHILACGVLLGLTAGGIIFLLISPPRGSPIQLTPLPTPAAPLVYVTGEVVHPGVYTMAINSRIGEAIRQSGGFTENAEQSAVNLASPVFDGLHIHVPARGELISEFQHPEKNSQPSTLVFPVEINTANQEELELLPGIGSTRAQSIIEYRQNQGGFTSKEQIQDVPGIGEGIYQQIKELITVGSAPP